MTHMGVPELVPCRSCSDESQLVMRSYHACIRALPGLAQTGSVDNQNAMATALRKDRLSIPTNESTIVVAPAITEKQPSFSVTELMKSTTEPAMINDSKVFELTSLE